MIRSAINHEVAVVGTGPAGLIAALALAEIGIDVALVGPRPPPEGRREDHRTAALFNGSIELLRNLGVWQGCADASTALRAIRIIDDRDALLRAPEVLFRASEVGLMEFGYNVPNDALTRSLWRRIDALGTRVMPTPAVHTVTLSAAHAIIEAEDCAPIMVRLVVAADGRNSVCRQAAQISTKSDTYPQTAITCTFRHQRLHDGISTEFHRPSGPLTAVPMPGHASSLVWVCNQREAETAMAVDDTSFIELLETRLQGLLGCINSVTTRTAFPLSAMHAEVHAKQRVVLVGEAGHVIPPIGAQGLNLGLRDCAALAECLTDARCRSDDVGGPTTLAAYNSGRRFDVWSRSGAVDILNRSLLSSFLPTHLTRGAGLHAMKHIAPLRRWAIEVGMAPAISRHLSLLQPGGGDLLRQRRHAN